MLFVINAAEVRFVGGGDGTVSIVFDNRWDVDQVGRINVVDRLWGSNVDDGEDVAAAIIETVGWINDVESGWASDTKDEDAIFIEVETVAVCCWEISIAVDGLDGKKDEMPGMNNGIDDGDGNNDDVDITIEPIDGDGAVSAW